MNACASSPYHTIHLSLSFFLSPFFFLSLHSLQTCAPFRMFGDFFFVLLFFFFYCSISRLVRRMSYCVTVFVVVKKKKKLLRDITHPSSRNLLLLDFLFLL